MCWNAPVSFITFVLGTLMNATFYKLMSNHSIAPIIIYWQYTLCMQIPEGIAWVQLNNEESVQEISWIAFFLNITQPFILLFMVKYFIKSVTNYGSVAIVLYTSILISEKVWYSIDIAPPPGCNHLDLKYWNPTTTTMYVLTSLFIFADIPDKFWASVNAFIFIGSLLFAMTISSCGVGSLFCWLIVFSSLILYIIHFLNSRYSCAWNGEFIDIIVK